MKKLHAIFIILLTAYSVCGQERIVRTVPDIPGYQTLICDFHLHTVFSDGQVWPTVRVDEAWLEGVDAIAITDHLEYQPHKEDIRTDYNRSWQLAQEYAKDKGVIVIAGTEITKGMPPGHLNAIFIKDASGILNDDYKKAIEAAAGQGAFIMWNHPGWKPQQPDTMKWWDEHTWLFEKGWLHGIEIVNYGEFYPEAINWAKDKKLTMLGNSDRHGPFTNFTDTDQHRPSTLVFVTERSERGIREALFNGRTAIYNGKNLIGPENILEPLALRSLEITQLNNNRSGFVLKNQTEFFLEMHFIDRIYDDWEHDLVVKPGFETLLRIGEETLTENIDVVFTNFITGTGEKLIIPLELLLNVDE